MNNTVKTAKGYYVVIGNRESSWTKRGTILAAQFEEQAKERAALIMLQKNGEEVLECYPITVYPDNHVITNDNYPYGRLRATAMQSIERNSKGFRSVLQTINPKNNPNNAPKKSTKTNVIFFYTIDSNAHFDTAWFRPDSWLNLNKLIYALMDFGHVLTPEAKNDFLLTCITFSKLNAKMSSAYGHIEWEALKPIVETSVKCLVEAVNSPDVDLLPAIVDVMAIEALKPANR